MGSVRRVLTLDETSGDHSMNRFTLVCAALGLLMMSAPAGAEVHTGPVLQVLPSGDKDVSEDLRQIGDLLQTVR